MNDQTIEKLAEMLGKCAATGDSRELVKQAGAEQLILPLLSATAGGAAGYLGTQKEKNKVRNALYGALGSGLAGAGVQALMPMADDLINGKSDGVDLGGKGGIGSSGGLLGNVGAGLEAAGDWVKAPIRSWAGVLGAAGGVGAVNAPVGGSSWASRAEKGLTGLYEKITGKNKLTGEVNTALTEGKIKPFGSGKNTTDPARVLQAVITQNPNDPAVKYLQRHGHFPPVDRHGRSDARQILVSRLNQLARGLAPAGGGRRGGSSPTLPPDFLDQLAKAHKGPAGRTLAGRLGRGGANLGAGYVSGILTDFLARYGYNLLRGQPATE